MGIGNSRYEFVFRTRGQGKNAEEREGPLAEAARRMTDTILWSAHVCGWTEYRLPLPLPKPNSEMPAHVARATSANLCGGGRWGDDSLTGARHRAEYDSVTSANVLQMLYSYGPIYLDELCSEWNQMNMALTRMYVKERDDGYKGEQSREVSGQAGGHTRGADTEVDESRQGWGPRPNRHYQERGVVRRGKDHRR